MKLATTITKTLNSGGIDDVVSASGEPLAKCPMLHT